MDGLEAYEKVKEAKRKGRQLRPLKKKKISNANKHLNSHINIAIYNNDSNNISVKVAQAAPTCDLTHTKQTKKKKRRNTQVNRYGSNRSRRGLSKKNPHFSLVILLQEMKRKKD